MINFKRYNSINADKHSKLNIPVKFSPTPPARVDNSIMKNGLCGLFRHIRQINKCVGRKGV